MTTSAAGVLARLRVARARLHAADPVMAGLIDRRPDYDPRHRLDGIPPMDLFGALVFQVTGQQLSVASRRRIQEMFGGHLPSPAELLQADPARLRQAGLSGRKISTLRDLAERLTDGRLSVDALSALPDEQIIAELTQVPGIGPWTAFLAGHPCWAAFWDKRHGVWRVSENDPDSGLYAVSRDADTVIRYMTAHS
jgi:3-methyladenine DNA glycosylase/8-oxoguanine DNA glycosylase